MGSSVELTEREWHLVYVILVWFLSRLMEPSPRARLQKITEAIRREVPGVDLRY